MINFSLLKKIKRSGRISREPSYPPQNDGQRWLPRLLGPSGQGRFALAAVFFESLTTLRHHSVIAVDSWIVVENWGGSETLSKVLSAYVF
jgi:hypothetical protein